MDPKPVMRPRSLAARAVPFAVICGGAILVVLGTFLIDRLTGTDGGFSDWVPSAAGAVGGWIALVLLAIAVWHVWRLAIGLVPGPHTGEIGGMDDRVRRYLPPALLGLAILLGFFFFK